MKKVGKSVFFIVVALILVVSYLSFFGWTSPNGDFTKTYVKGADTIRWGIDIRGGVDVTFAPPEDYDATDEEMTMAEGVLKERLVNLNITDYEVYADKAKDRIIVRFPWKADEVDFNPEAAIKELGETAELTFRELALQDAEGNPTGDTKDKIVLEGKDIVSAQAGISSKDNSHVVALKLTAEGAAKFSEATGRLVNKQISIWMDNTMISAPQVQQQITDGEATISSPTMTAESAKSLAAKINSGALPFKLETDNFNTISPTLGMGAKDAMVLAGVIAFIIVAVFMISLFRLPGFIAVIALAGQLSLTIAAITGFFPIVPSFTLTLPGIAGIILAIGFGVDANIITASRIKEELKSGKTLDASIRTGYSKAFTAILDGNITVIIVAVILMGAFGPPSSAFVKLFSPIFRWFGPSTAGSIYSFGYTLLVGVILNLLMGVFCSRLMIQSLSRFKPFRKAWLYGGDK